MAAWMPCDPMAVVKVAAEHAGTKVWQATPYKDGLTVEMLTSYGDMVGRDSASWHLAALALLREVWR